eukprot:6210857-Pleurochrysis_carterae.AAC.1
MKGRRAVGVLCSCANQETDLVRIEVGFSPAQVEITDISYPVLMALLDHLYSDSIEVQRACLPSHFRVNANAHAHAHECIREYGIHARVQGACL